MISANLQDGDSEILNEFIKAGAILRGHFILSSGLHSDTYMQCARVLSQTQISKKLCRALAQKTIERLGSNAIDMIVAPAMGGVVVGYEMGCQLNVPTIFVERVNGAFELRRGFEITPDSKILIVEDVITTGKSSLEAFECVQRLGGSVVAESCLVDRSDSKTDIEKDVLRAPLISLLNIEVKTFNGNDIPDELKDIPATKPGSRFLKK